MGWKELENEMSAGLDAEFAEPINHIPMARPDVNARWTEDPTRPKQMFDAATLRPVGIFEWQAHEEFMGKGREETRASPATHHSTRLPMLFIDVRQLNSPIKVGDGIAIIERNEAFRVTDVRADGQGRLAIQLAHLGLHSTST